jgi:urea ABC transporter permease protein UrtB
MTFDADLVVMVGISVITTASTLLLISLGLAVVFGLMRIVNMSHGEFMMIGAFATTTLVRLAQAPLWIAVIAATLLAAALGALTEILLIRHLYKRRLVDTLLVTFGLSLILYQIATDIFGSTSPGIPTPLGSFSIGIYRASVYSLVMAAASVATCVALALLFRKSQYGLFARAIAQNPEMASVLGVVLSRIYLQTFVLGSGLAGLAGSLLAPLTAVGPGFGQSYVGQAFLVVVMGGPAFLTGSALASAVLGTVSSLLSQATTSLWGLSGLFLCAIVAIRFYPQGLSGRWARQL